MAPRMAKQDEPDAEVGSSSAQIERTPCELEKQAKQDVRVARAMFWGGFAALPFLWFVAYLHFRRAALLPHADIRLALYVRRCRTGALAGGVILFIWLTMVSLCWRSWGQFGRTLMLVLPEEAMEL